MRLLAVLFGLFLLASPLLTLTHNPITTGEAGSVPSWNKVFNLHDGTVLSSGTYDWLNASGPAHPIPIDYDGDTIQGITIKKNVPPQRYHAWILYPSVDSPVLISGQLGINLWAYSQGNESGTIISAQFHDITQAQFSDPFLGTLIAQGTSGLAGPFYSNIQLVNILTPSVSYTLPQGHFLAATLQRGDSLNDWLIVQYDTPAYVSNVTATTSDFVSVDEVHAEDSSNTTRTAFSDVEDVNISANVSDPFGSYDIRGANVTISYAGNQTVVRSMLPMNLTSWDSSPVPRWKVFECTMPSLVGGSYVANVTALDYSGYPSWLNTSFTILSADHFGVVAPGRETAGDSFSLSVTALDQFDSVVSDWAGTVYLQAFMTDKLSPANGTLYPASVLINSSDFGTVTVTDATYDSGDEQIFIRASAGLTYGWSDLVSISSGPVVNVTISPSAEYPSYISVESGRTQAFTVNGFDAQGNTNTTWLPYWSVSGGIGTVLGAGMSVVFLATNLGTGYLNCTNNATGAVGNVSISVTIGTLARINITSPQYPLVIREGDSIVLTATGYDIYDNVVSIADANWTSTSGHFLTGTGPTAVFVAGLVPQTGEISVRSAGITGTLNVIVLNALDGPSLKTIPAQIKNEDAGDWDLSLTSYWQDVNGTTSLYWWVDDVNASLYLISHDPAHNSVMKFFAQPDQSGEDEFTLWVLDPQGHTAFQVVQIRIIPINDPPEFVNDVPTELYVKFETAYTFDFSYFVNDVDNDKEDLGMTSNAPPLSEGSFWNISFNALEAAFLFDRKDGDTSYFEIVTVSLFDPMRATDRVNIVVRATIDSPPDLNTTLPDVDIREGDFMIFTFDLDDYFYDLDGEPLYYTAGFENIPAPYIDSITHRVYFSAPGEWSGITEGTFIGTDSIGALKVDMILVNVTAVNDPPQVSEIDTVLVKHDVPYYLYLSPYVYDPDNSLDSLTFDISCSNVTKGMSDTGSYRLEMLFPANLTGPVYTNPYRVTVWMNVTDPPTPESPVGLTSGTQFDVLVTDNNPPTVIAEKPDQLYFTFPEDTYLNDSLMLYDIFSDVESGSTLNFTVQSSGPHVHFIVLTNGAISLSADLDWYGAEVLNITARDPQGGWAFVQANIVVTPVNDAPMAVVINEKLLHKSGNTIFDLAALVYFYDPDGDDLVITASPEANAAVVGDKLYITLSSGVDVISVTLQAYDGELSSEMVSVKVGIAKTMAEKIGYPYSLPLVLLAAGVAGYFIGMRLPRPYALENLFLIHNDGRLVSHVTKEENTNLDKDVVSAMFTAVQEFVRDSFQKGEIGLKKLEIGDKNVVIEKGNYAYVALIYSGWPQKEVFDMLPMLLRDIEERYKGKLEHWNGTKRTVNGVDKMLQEYMENKFKPGTWHEEDEIAEKEWVDILDKEA
jgi:hypothetical protein